MKRKIIIHVALIVMLMNAVIYAQDSVKTLIISGKVGEYIDGAENSKYDIFPKYNIVPEVEDMKSIMFLVSDNDRYYVRINFKDSFREIIYQISREDLVRYAEKIELFDEIEEGNFEKGYSTISLDSAGGKYYVRFRNKYYEKFTWINNYKPDKKFKPNFGIGAGIKFINIDLSDMKRFYDYVEETVRSNGYDIQSNNFDESASNFYVLNLYVYLFESIGVFFEAGKGFESSWDTYYASGSVKYYVDINRLNWFKPYLGAGFSKIGFKGRQVYGVRISEINNGSWWRLDEIKTEASSKGITVNLGFDAGYFDYSNKYYFTFFTDLSYAFFPEKKYNYSYDGPEFGLSKSSTTRFKGLMITSGIKIYL